MSVSRNTFYKLSNALVQIVALYPISKPEDNEEQAFATCLTCRLLHNMNWADKRWQGGYIPIVIPKYHIER